MCNPQLDEGVIDVSNLAEIQRDPDYQELVRRRSSLGWTLSLIMLVIYFGFILLVAYAPKFLGMPVGDGVTTIGIPIGLCVIVWRSCSPASMSARPIPNTTP